VAETKRHSAVYALLVFGAMLPATIVIPVLRSFVELHWPNQEWLMHAFLAVNLLGAVALGPFIAVKAERLSKRRLISTLSIVTDGLLLLLVSTAPAMAPLIFIRFIQGGAYISGVSILMGSIRRNATHAGIVGSAAILAILIGIPIGAIAGKTNPALPFYIGAASGILTGLLSYFILPVNTDSEHSDVSFVQLLKSKALLMPSVVVGLERLAVGAFVVTLQLYGHHVLDVPMQKISTWFSIFLATFALSTFPMAKWADSIGKMKLISIGALTYAATFILIPWVSVSLLPIVFFIGGIASGAIYGPCLQLASAAVSVNARSSAMAFLNAAGTLGMFIGSTLAGVLSNVLIEIKVERASAYAAVFVVAGVMQLGSVLMAWRARTT
jgi:MFS family permease